MEKGKPAAHFSGIVDVYEIDVSALKWFHDNGVPQVIQTTAPLFREDT